MTTKKKPATKKPAKSDLISRKATIAMLTKQWDMALDLVLTRPDIAAYSQGRAAAYKSAIERIRKMP